MKICTKCKTEYGSPLDGYFHLRDNTKDGFNYHCKKCVNDRHKSRYYSDHKIEKSRIESEIKNAEKKENLNYTSSIE